MHRKTKKRLFFWGGFILSASMGVCIILFCLSDNISYFMSPTSLLQNKIYQEVKLGGYVKSGSITHLDIDTIEFEVTDRKNSILVRYKGALPLIFREEQGVIISGTLDLSGKVFIARYVLAKHDENYRPISKG